MQDEIGRLFRARVSHVDARPKPRTPRQIGGQYPKSKVSDFHFVEEGDSAFFVGISNLRRWSLPVFASGSACGRSRHRATRYAAIDNPENRMSQRKMQVLDDLHVIGRNDYAMSPQGPSFLRLGTRDADRRRSGPLRHLQCVQTFLELPLPLMATTNIS